MAWSPRALSPQMVNSCSRIELENLNIDVKTDNNEEVASQKEMILQKENDSLRLQLKNLQDAARREAPSSPESSPTHLSSIRQRRAECEELATFGQELISISLRGVQEATVAFKQKQAEVERIQAELSDLQSQHTKLKDEAQRRCEWLPMTQEDLSARAVEHKQAKEDMGSLRAEKMSICKEAHQVRNQVLSLSQLLANKTIKETEQDRVADQASEENRRLQEETRRLREELQRCQEELAAAKEVAQAGSALPEALEENLKLKAELEQQRSATSQAQAEAARLRQRLAEKEAEEAGKSLALQEALSEKEALQNRLEETHTELATCHEAQSQVISLTQLLDHRVEQAHQTEKALEQALEESKRLQAELVLREQESAIDREAAAEGDVSPTSRRSSESRLRSAMTDQASTSDDLESAIKGVEALLGEARRELAKKQLRARRAATEKLNDVRGTLSAEVLAEAIEEAKATGVEKDDIDRAQERLVMLQSMTPEQIAAKLNDERLVQLKKDAFVYIKQDKAEELLQMLVELEREGTAWRDWKDHSQRTMLKLSLTIGKRCKAILQRIQQGETPEDVQTALRAPPEVAPVPAPQVEEAAAPEPVPETASPPAAPTLQLPNIKAVHEVELHREEGPSPSAFVWSAPSHSEENEEPPAAPPAPPVQEVDEDTKRQAFACVVRNRVSDLEAILDRFPNEVWSTWQNKAGYDLLSLAEERKSSDAYAFLARRLGLLQEQKRIPLFEGDCVWVFEPGDVQPLRATVMEDTPDEADEVLLQFWEGDNGIMPVPRAKITK